MAIDFDKAIKEYIDRQPEPEKKTPPVPVAVPLERIKGDPVTVFDRFAYNQLSDVVIDCQQWDTINVLVLPTGTSPSATVSVEGAASGLYVPLDTPGAVQTNVTTNKSFDVSVSTPFAKIRLSNVAGTFVAGQGFTVIVTPYRRGPLGVIDRANYGTITEAEGTVTLDVKGCGSAAIQITGTWSATASFEGTVGDATWVAVYGVVPGTGASVTSTTANGLWTVPCAGLSQIRVRASAFSTGTIIVNLRASGGSPSQVKVGIDQGTPGTTDLVTVATAQGAGAAIGAITGAAVITDANGTIQQYLRGLIASFVAKIGFDSTSKLRTSLYIQHSAAGDTAVRSISIALTGGNGQYTPTVGPVYYNGGSLDGDTFDGQYGNHGATVLASAARTAATTAALNMRVNLRGLILVVDVTARASTTTLQPKLTLKDPVTGSYLFDIWSAAAAINTSDNTYAYLFYPTASAAAALYTEKVDIALGRQLQLTVTPNDANSVTYSVGAYYLH